MLINQSIKDIKFGHNEAKRDHGLSRYFFDDGTIKSIFDEDKFFIFGRKGSGKSAICRHLNELADGEYNLFSKVLSFKDFGMERLYKFSDRDFRSPTQYQTFWRYLLYLELAKMVMKDESIPQNNAYFALKEFISINFSDLDLEYHDIVKRTSDMGFKLLLPEAFSGAGFEVYKTNAVDGQIKVPYNRVVRELEKYLLNIDFNTNNKYIIMLDELDKKYDLSSEYKDLVLSLLDVAGDINSLTYNPKNLYVIVFLRSDIVNKLKDPDLNKYYDDRIDLDWLVEGMPSQSNLRKLINLRIKTSIQELEKAEDAWKYCFSDEQILDRTIFEFMIDRTFHRPRDIIQFCKVCQEVAGTKKEISKRDVLNAEERYSLWLKKEITDEVHIEIPQIDNVFDLFRKHGRQTFTLKEFENKKHMYTDLRGLDSEQILSKLFDFGIIGNYDNSGYRPRVFFLFRSKHDDVKFNKSEDFIVFRGLNKALKLFRY